jgi:Amt family ammonium transporter
MFILWLGWYGFNGGSTLAFNNDVDNIILNTTIAAIAGGLISFFHSFWFQQKAEIYEKTIGGILGGLVAITASAHIVNLGGSLIIGVIAGIVHNLSFDLISKKLRIDDPVGAIPVHGVCGTLGILILPFFAVEGALSMSVWEQFGVQALGAFVAFAWAAGIGFVTFKLIKKFFGLRVSPEEEAQGITIPGTLVIEEEENEEEVDMELLKQLMSE